MPVLGILNSTRTEGLVAGGGVGSREQCKLITNTKAAFAHSQPRSAGARRGDRTSALGSEGTTHRDRACRRRTTRSGRGPIRRNPAPSVHAGPVREGGYPVRLGDVDADPAPGLSHGSHLRAVEAVERTRVGDGPVREAHEACV